MHYNIYQVPTKIKLQVVFKYRLLMRFSLMGCVCMARIGSLLKTLLMLSWWLCFKHLSGGSISRKKQINSLWPSDVIWRQRSWFPYPEPVVFQWQSSGNPVCLELRPQCTLECHWRNASVLPVVLHWSSSGFPVVFQCVPIMQINTGSPLGHHWVLASASVVPVASQCTCGSSGLPVCSNYAN